MPGTTEFDVRFRLLGIPVRVHPIFWIVAILLGPHEDARAAMIWVGCVFVSIVVHEYGHGLMARAFGYSASIVLAGFGGLCYSEGERQAPWQRLAVLISGPGAGFLFAALLYGGYRALGHPELSLLGLQIYRYLLYINIAWGLFNLLPIIPMDGGRIAGVVLGMFHRARGERWAHILSMFGAGLLALYMLKSQEYYLALLFAYFGVMNYQVLEQQYYASRSGGGDDWWRA